MNESLDLLYTMVFMVCACELIMVGVMAYTLPRHLDNIREICDNVREVRFDVHETKKTADSLDWKIQRKSDVCVDNADLLAGPERIEKEIKKVRKANGR